MIYGQTEKCTGQWQVIGTYFEPCLQPFIVSWQADVAMIGNESLQFPYTFIVDISISEPSCRDRLLCRWQQTFSKIKINKFPKPLKPVKTVEVVMGVEALPGKGLPKPWKVEKPLDYRIDRMNEWTNE